MCGAPAEMWRKFNFSTAPPWAFLLGAIVTLALSRRASGYLPMTRACAQKLRLVRWSFAGAILLAVVCWIAAVIIGSAAGDALGGVVFALVVLGFAALILGFIFAVVGRAFYGPTANVMEQQYGQYEPVVELKRVHPNFVIAVRQLQQARAAHLPAAPAAQFGHSEVN